MIHLYVKRHKVTRLLYFGRTYRDPFRYYGSGKYWRRHLQTYGYNIDTVFVISFKDENIAQCCEFAVNFSVKNDIVNSPKWANLVIENVVDGHHKGVVHSKETLRKMSEARRGKPRRPETIAKMVAARTGVPRSEETKDKIRAARIGSKASDETKAKMSASRRVQPPRKHTDETKAKISAAKTGKPGHKMTPEHKQRLTDIASARKGFKHSEETKAKMSASRRQHLICKTKSCSNNHTAYSFY